jgi:beta-lactamase class A
MTVLISRRNALIGSLLVASSIAGSPAAADRSAIDDGQAGLADLERKYGGRLGVAALDVATGKKLEHRAGERFAMCSTFKLLAAALVLTRVDRQQESLDRRIVYAKEKVVAYSPTTEKHVGEGMTLGEICEAGLTLSDNTAANLMLESFGGPAQVTAYARTLGDEVTRLDRMETELNEARPGDPRDTTTPAAMLENMRRIVLGDALSGASRDQMTAWLLANKTGDKRIRAGIPKGWRVADKTGSGDNGAANDIAVLWPPDSGPLIITAYFAESAASADDRSAVLAEAATLAVKI